MGNTVGRYRAASDGSWVSSVRFDSEVLGCAKVSATLGIYLDEPDRLPTLPF